MKNTVKRFIAASLAVVMVVLMVPFGVLSVVAAEYRKIESAEEFDGYSIGKGYNLLGNEKISASALKTPQVFNRQVLYETLAAMNRKPEVVDDVAEKYTYDFSESISSYIQKQTNKTSWSVGANAKIKMVSLELKYNQSVETSSTQSNTQSMQYAILTAKKTLGRVSIDLYDFESIYEKNPSVFHDDFMLAVSELTEDNAEEFINRFGTHVITSYNRGGEAVATYRGESLTTSVENSEQTSWEVSGSVGVDKIASVSASYGEAASNSTGTNTSNQKVHATVKSIGSTVTMKLDTENKLSTAKIDEFFAGISDIKYAIIVDENFDMIPIWDLLKAAGLKEPAKILKNYVEEQLAAEVSQFYQDVGETYEEDALSQMDGWLTADPDDVTIITTAEQLASIGTTADMPLDGIYVLANNIDLSGYANWTPIGTSTAAFKGEFYGNYNTIENLTITSATGGSAGLFGYVGEDGLISNLRVEGEISATPAVNTYIGAIAAKNTGTIENCYDAVTYNVDYENISDLNIPARDVSFGTGTNNTVTIRDQVGIRLSGTQTGNIVIEENDVQSPVYIILNNAHITGSSEMGTIYNEGARPIYIISTGTSNSVTGATDAIAINAENSEVCIFGDAELTVTGGNGADGEDGADISDLSDETSQAGDHGKNGREAIKATILQINCKATIRIHGGNGGKGGNGGSIKFPGLLNMTVGQKGGNGGNGAEAVSTEHIKVFNTDIEFKCGNGGDGGKGGDGSIPTSCGAGGNGGDSEYTIFVNPIIASNSNVAIINGTGGKGGSGGAKNYGTVAVANGLDGSSIHAELNGHHYKLIKDALTWHEAKTACEALGGHLVTIASKAENEVVNTILGYDAVFIGMSDHEAEDEWKWVTGEAITDETYTNWAPGEPNKAGDQDYGAVYGLKDSDWLGMWDDASNISRYYICEWDQYTSIIETTNADETPNILSGITCGAVSSNAGTIKKINRDVWNAINAQITEPVKKLHYYSDKNERFNRSDVTITVDDNQYDGYTTSFNNFCRQNQDQRMGYIYISANKCKRYIPIEITRTVAEGIEIIQPGPTEFVKDATFSIDGLQVQVQYNNENYVTAPLEADDEHLSWIAPDLSSYGQKTVIVRYQDADVIAEAQYELHVGALATTGIEIASYPKDYTIQQQGTALKTDGLIIQVLNNDGSTENIGVEDERLSLSVYPSLCTVGNSTVTVSYNDRGVKHTATYQINIIENPNFQHTWNPGIISTPATHTAEGEKLYTCTVDNCGATKTEVIPKLVEHTYGDWTQHDATQHKRTCACEAVEYENHSFAEGVVTLAPTYTEEGSMTYTCTTCGYVKTESIPSIGIENAPTIMIEGDAFVTGQLAEVRIRLENNPGIASMKFALTYDMDALELTNITYNTGIGGQAQQPQNYNSPVTLNWINGTADSEGDFLFATLTFKVKSNAPVGSTTKLSLTYDENDIYDITETNIEFLADDYEALVIDYVPGDLNGDNTVNNKDISRLFQYLSGWDIEVNEKALDINGDGAVNNKDLTRLFQYMSGWDVEINYPSAG